MANIFPSRLVDSVDGQIGQATTAETVVKTIHIDIGNLVTNDEEGVLEYLNTQELIIQKGQVVLIITEEVSIYVEVGYVVTGYTI